LPLGGIITVATVVAITEGGDEAVILKETTKLEKALNHKGFWAFSFKKNL